MPSRAHSMLALRISLGTLWGAVMIIAGLAVIARLAPRAPSQDLLRMTGVGLAASGMYVFTCVVADRLFPRADTRLCGSVQALLALLMIAGAVCFGIFYVRGELGTL